MFQNLPCHPLQHMVLGYELDNILAESRSDTKSFLVWPNTPPLSPPLSPPSEKEKLIFACIGGGGGGGGGKSLDEYLIIGLRL